MIALEDKIIPHVNFMSKYKPFHSNYTFVILLTLNNSFFLPLEYLKEILMWKYVNVYWLKVPETAFYCFTLVIQHINPKALTSKLSKTLT